MEYKAYGVRGKAEKLISIYRKDPSNYVVENMVSSSNLSSWSSTRVILGPLLILIDLNDLPKVCVNSKVTL